jgi:hypothetical protein
LHPGLIDGNADAGNLPCGAGLVGCRAAESTIGRTVSCMSATSTDTAPVIDPRTATREETEAALGEVRRQLADRQNLDYADPDRVRLLSPAERTEYNVAGVRLDDLESALVRRLAVLTRREQAAEAPPTTAQKTVPTVTLPVGTDPAAIPADLLRRYQDCVLAVVEKKTGAAGRLAQVEAQLVERTEAARREAAAQSARQRRSELEAEAQAKVEAGEAEKARVEGMVRLESARQVRRKACVALAQAMDEVCKLGVEVENAALHDECVAELGRAVTSLPSPWNRRLVSALGNTRWRSAGGRPVRLG